VYPLSLELLDLLGDELLEQAHQRGDLARRALPVLFREREQRQDFDAGLDRSLHCLAHRRHPGPVAERPRQPALARPAPVAIHDDGDVARHRAVELDLPEEIVRHLRPP